MVFARTKLVLEDNCFEEDPGSVTVTLVGPHVTKLYKKGYDLIKTVFKAADRCNGVDGRGVMQVPGPSEVAGSRVRPTTKGDLPERGISVPVRPGSLENHQWSGLRGVRCRSVVLNLNYNFISC